MSGIYHLNKNAVKQIGRVFHMKHLLDPDFNTYTFNKMGYTNESRQIIAMKNAYVGTGGTSSGQQLGEYYHYHKKNIVGNGTIINPQLDELCYVKNIVDNVASIGINTFEKHCVHLNYNTQHILGTMQIAYIWQFVNLFNEFTFEENVTIELQNCVNKIYGRHNIDQFVNIYKIMCENNIFIPVIDTQKNEILSN